MKIILFGASGKTGKIFLNLVLQKGHLVTAIVRNASKIQLKHDNLTVKTLDLSVEDELLGAISGHDLVVSCLGGNANNKSTALSDMILNIVNAMKKAKVNHIFYIGSAGIHNEMPDLISRIIINIFFKNAIADHKLSAQAIINSGFNYLIMRPLSLIDGEMTKKFRTSYDAVPKGGKNISREDLAFFLSEAIGKDDYINKSIGICY